MFSLAFLFDFGLFIMLLDDWIVEVANVSSFVFGKSLSRSKFFHLNFELLFKNKQLF